MTKHYKNFDMENVMDTDHYTNHVSAMTGEQLHSKSDIAAELAYRDMQIEQLQRERDEIAAHYSLIYLSARGLSLGKDWNKGTHAVKHGHRARLIDAVSSGDKSKSILAKLKIEQQIKALENLHKKQVFELADQMQLKREIEQLRNQLGDNQ